MGGNMRSTKIPDGIFIITRELPTIQELLHDNQLISFGNACYFTYEIVSLRQRVSYEGLFFIIIDTPFDGERLIQTSFLSHFHSTFSDRTKHQHKSTLLCVCVLFAKLIEEVLGYMYWWYWSLPSLANVATTNKLCLQVASQSSFHFHSNQLFPLFYL